MTHWIYRFVVVGLLTAVAMGAEPRKEATAPVPPPPRPHPLRVIVITGGHGFDHKTFFDIFAGQPDIRIKEVVQPEGLKWFAPEKWDSFDVMVWYDLWSQSKPTGAKSKISETDRQNLMALLNKGKPLVALHHCLSDYMEWPEALKILGGRYWIGKWTEHEPASFHPDNSYRVVLADPQHPITRFMHDFDMTDETYNHLEVSPDVKPLFTIDHPQSTKVVGWTHTYGKSRVVYLQPGHGPTSHDNPNYRRLVIQSIRWAAGQLPETSDEGFVPLFNGKDLDGWQVAGKPEGFSVKDGILHSDARSHAEWMRTEKEYGDYILRVEWRVSKGGNAGVFIRCKDKSAGYPWETGSEVQIDNLPRDLMHCTGTLYGNVAVDPRPDESFDVWHEFQIECRGPFIKIFCDNIPIIDVDSRTVPALKNKPLRGYIGLQDSHNPTGSIEYRKVMIKELPPSLPEEPRRSADDSSFGQPQQTATWRLGAQAYTFRSGTFFEAVDKVKSLGLKYIEAYPGQPISPERRQVSFGDGMNAAARDLVKTKLSAAGVKLVNYGVVGLSNNEAEARKIFDFAKDMGIETIVAEPAADAFDLLDKLTEEYKINVDIHNHPKPSHYYDPQILLDAVKGHSKRIGACADLGHWPRSGISPLEAVKKLEGRIISLHVKDLSEQGPNGRDVPWGTGTSDIKAILTELHRQKFVGVFSAEYEYDSDQLMSDVAQCVKYFREVAKELGQPVD